VITAKRLLLRVSFFYGDLDVGEEPQKKEEHVNQEIDDPAKTF
jgi:hypothetical protein